MYDIASTPEVTAGFRFMAAALGQAMAILTVHYAFSMESRYPGHRVSLIGWAIEAQSIALHQGYYFMWWAFQSKDNADLIAMWSEFRGVTSIALIMMALGWVMVASPYLRTLVGGAWPVLGAVMSVALWAAGYWFTVWL